jgi:hypothetical protein
MHNDFNHSTSGQTFGVHDNVAHCSISRKTMLANQRGEKSCAMDNNTSPIEDLFMVSAPILCPTAA